MDLSTLSEKPNKPNFAGFIPFHRLQCTSISPDSFSQKVVRMESRRNYSSFFYGAVGCLCILLFMACSSAPKKKTQADSPRVEKSEIQKEDDKIPTFDDLRGYLYPGRKTPGMR